MVTLKIGTISPLTMSVRVLSIPKDFVDLQVRHCEQLGSPAFGIPVGMPMQVCHT